MSINKDYVKLNTQYLNQNVGCNCCCNSNNQSAYSPFGIFYGMEAIQAPVVNTQFSFWNGINPAFLSCLNNFSFPALSFPSFGLPSFSFPSFSMPSFVLPDFSSTVILGKSKSKQKFGSYNLAPLAKTTVNEVLKNISKNDNSFSQVLKAKGLEYNSKVGHDVTTYALSKAKSKSGGDCAKFVSDAYKEAAFDIGGGHAYKKKVAIENVLKKDSQKFAEVKLANKEDLRKLPAGSIVVYNKGECDYSSTYGHVFIATGEGRGVSDFLENNPRFDVSADVSVYIPTKPIEGAKV